MAPRPASPCAAGTRATDSTKPGPSSPRPTSERSPGISGLAVGEAGPSSSAPPRSSSAPRRPADPLRGPAGPLRRTAPPIRRRAPRSVTSSTDPPSPSNRQAGPVTRLAGPVTRLVGPVTCRPVHRLHHGIHPRSGSSRSLAPRARLLERRPRRRTTPSRCCTRAPLSCSRRPSSAPRVPLLHRGPRRLHRPPVSCTADPVSCPRASGSCTPRPARLRRGIPSRAFRRRLLYRSLPPPVAVDGEPAPRRRSPVPRIRLAGRHPPLPAPLFAELHPVSRSCTAPPACCTEGATRQHRRSCCWTGISIRPVIAWLAGRTALEKNAGA